MALGTSLLLIAIGAILAFAVDAQVSGIDINVIGAILLIVGVIGIAISMLVLATASANGTPTDTTTTHTHV